jgi:DNA-binding beta-propeller fold protein YncE
VTRVAVALFALGAIGCGSTPKGTSVKLPDGASGIGFDDLRYSSSLHRVLVPAGRTGRLDLIDPETFAVTSIGGFSSKPDYSGGHDDGPTSVEEARGKLYVTDRTAGTLVTVDPSSKSIVTSTALASGPDYVRFVESTGELWVTEPSADQIEIFKLADDGTPASAATVPVQNAPESLVIDARRGRAYTHRWQGSTVVLDVTTRAVVAEWPNGCASSRGIALDEARGWLFAACNDGTLTLLDVDHDGHILSTLERGSGFDVIGYSAKLGHLYLAGSSCSCLVIAGVTSRGELSFLERQSAPGSTHCATADDRGNAWVCDPDGGQLLRVEDHQPSSL